MSLSDRDKKIVIVIVPLLVLAAYWFLLLAPKREEATTAAAAQTKAAERLQLAEAATQNAQTAEVDFTDDYAEIVRLGKAIPAQVDMPSLLVQLNSAAAGTGIQFTRITTGERLPAATTAAPATGSESSGSTPTDAGGPTAQSASGQAVESANNAAATSGDANAAAEQSGVDPADAQTSTSSGSGLPVGGGAAAPAGTEAAATTSATGLETVSLELEFVGDFFNLADFFHRTKRFVQVAGREVLVNGRLVTFEGVSFASDTQIFPRVRAELMATVYLSPEAQGATAGATPEGPAPAAPGTTPASTPAPTPTAPAAPTAVATP
jgi:hypothetical protein